MASRKKTKKVVAKVARAAVAVGTVARAIKKAAKKAAKKVVRGRAKAGAAAARGSTLEGKRPAAAPAKPVAVAKKAKPASRRAEPVKAPRAVVVSTPAPRRAASKPAATGESIDEGSVAPSFALLDQDSQMLSSDTLSGRPYVLYFYPKDDTPGCTKEACDFRDSLARFGSRGIRVIGVSPDAVGSHARFRDKYGLNFTLLSDPDKELAQAYGVWILKQNYGKEYMGIGRSTFLIDGDGVVRRAWRGVRVPGHIDEVLARAEELA